MARPLMLSAYGTQDDRLKLAALSQSEGRSGSEIIVEFIRTRYREVFGDLDPSLTVPEK